MPARASVKLTLMGMLESDTPFTHGRDGEAVWFGLLNGHETFVSKVDSALQAEHHLPLTWFEVLLRLVIDNPV